MCIRAKMNQIIGVVNQTIKTNKFALVASIQIGMKIHGSLHWGPVSVSQNLGYGNLLVMG